MILVHGTELCAQKTIVDSTKEHDTSAYHIVKKFIKTITILTGNNKKFQVI